MFGSSQFIINGFLTPVWVNGPVLIEARRGKTDTNLSRLYANSLDRRY
jgi:hypothetical protein